MRLHTNELSRGDLALALAKGQRAGLIAWGVGFARLEPHRSQTHQRAFEVKLDCNEKVPGDKRYRANPGTSGQGGDQPWAATYDEWGWLFAALYEKDPALVCGGTSKRPVYANAEDFHAQTKNAYRPVSV